MYKAYRTKRNMLRHNINEKLINFVVSLFTHFMVYIVTTNKGEFMGIYTYNPENLPYVQKLIEEKNCSILYVHLQCKK
jgi:hypothetical protein